MQPKPTRHPHPESSWTFRTPSDRKEFHDFANCLNELVFAVQLNESDLVKYYSAEIRRMFYEKGRSE